jgi:hypothetical protein
MASQPYNQVIQTVLDTAERWHMLKEQFGWGEVALFSIKINTWYGKLPKKLYLPLFRLIETANLTAVGISGILGERV